MRGCARCALTASTSKSPRPLRRSSESCRISEVRALEASASKEVQARVVPGIPLMRRRVRAEMVNGSSAVYDRLSAAAAALGIACRGGFCVEAGDDLPEVAPGIAGRTLVLLGFTGPRQWSVFSSSVEFADAKPDPLDRWSAAVIGQLAAQFDARPLYPFGGPPWWPFQQWARRAEALHSSPLGILMHEEFGLWHAYRGALLFAAEFMLPPRRPWPSPCASCTAAPCIAGCPAGAVAAHGFNRAACAAHVASPEGAACRSGCLSRVSCPVAVPHRYGSEQAIFHMRQLAGR
jgi:hypothetical protein